MRVSDFIEKDAIIYELNSSSKFQTLEEMIDLLCERGIISDKQPYLNALIEREKLGSTGIGRGAAIPHARVQFLDRMIVAFARSKKGIEFDSVDGKPVHFVFLILTPEDVPESYLALLARISKMVKDSEFRSRILEAKDAGEIYGILKQEDEKLDREEGIS